jgi:hypothetical protein
MRVVFLGRPPDPGAPYDGRLRLELPDDQISWEEYQEIVQEAGQERLDRIADYVSDYGPITTDELAPMFSLSLGSAYRILSYLFRHDCLGRQRRLERYWGGPKQGKGQRPFEYYRLRSPGRYVSPRLARKQQGAH